MQSGACWLLIFLAAAIMVYFPLSTTAATPLSALQATQDQIAQLTVNQSFTCSGATASGSLFNAFNNACGSTEIFGCAIKRFEFMIGTAMGKIYCGIQNMMLGPIRAALILCIALFGVMFMTGMIHATAKEAFLFLFKITFVWAFASDAQLAIQTGYRFFFGFAKEGVDMMLAGISAATSKNLNNLLSAPDALINSILTTFSFQGGAPQQPVVPPGTVGAPLPVNPNAGCSFAAGGADSRQYCLSFLPKLILITMLLFPPLFLIIALFLFTYLWLFARATFGFLYALAMISFLFTLLPIFLGFFLFKSTRELFESWLRYLISNTLQIVIVFAFLGMMMLVDFTTFFDDLNKVLRYNTFTIGAFAPFKFTFSYCWVCKGFSMPDFANASGLSSVSPTCSGSGVSSIFDMGTNIAFLKYVTVKILAFWILGWAMQQFLMRSGELAQKLGGHRYASALGHASTGEFGSASQSIAMPGESMAKGAAEGFKRGGLEGAAKGAIYGVEDEKYSEKVKGMENHVEGLKMNFQKAGRDVASAENVLKFAKKGTKQYKDAAAKLKAARNKQKAIFKQLDVARGQLGELKKSRHKHTKGGLVNEMRGQYEQNLRGSDDWGREFGGGSYKEQDEQYSYLLKSSGSEDAQHGSDLAQKFLNKLLR